MDTPEEKDSMYLETDILPSLAGTDQVKMYFVCSNKFEGQYLIEIILRSLLFLRDIMISKLQARVFQTSNWWSPVKTAASAIYANRHYLGLYRLRNPGRLAGNEVYSNGNGTT